MHSKGNSAASALQASHEATCAVAAWATSAETVKRPVSRSGSSIMAERILSGRGKHSRVKRQRERPLKLWAKHYYDSCDIRCRIAHSFSPAGGRMDDEIQIVRLEIEGRWS